MPVHRANARPLTRCVYQKVNLMTNPHIPTRAEGCTLTICRQMLTSSRRFRL